MQATKIGSRWDGGRVIDCLVLAKDKVIRAMLGTCVRALGLTVRTAGSSEPAFRAIARSAHRFQVVLIGPSLEDGDAAELARRLAITGACGEVLGFGFKQPIEGIPGVEVSAFPVGFPELSRRIEAAIERQATEDDGRERAA